jgi:hypothetical protein
MREITFFVLLVLFGGAGLLLLFAPQKAKNIILQRDFYIRSFGILILLVVIILIIQQFTIGFLINTIQTLESVE